MLAIYSGGMDSTVLLYKYKDLIKYALTFDYGSKHNSKEIECAKYHCNILGIKHQIINLDFNEIGIKSSLLKSGNEVPEGHYESENMKSTVVPFRNAIMLSIAISVAESNGLKSVAIANHYGDHAIYPDCRAEFIEAMNQTAKNGTYSEISIFAPFTSITKRDIALLGKDLNIDLSKTYSCYKGEANHCGKCGTCTERKEALNGFDFTGYKQ